MRLHRLLAIILLLESRGTVKAGELAYALESSERTIYRDIDILCESGLPIQSIPGPNGGFCFMKDYATNINKLNCDDIINLFLSGVGIRPAEYSENALSLRNTILKLENSIPKEYVPDVIKAKNRFYFDPSRWWDEISPSPMTDIVRKALWRNHKVQITYLKKNDMISTRIMRPYGLVVKNSEWYLIGYCENRNCVIGLKCDRINAAFQLEEKYVIPEDFSLEGFWKDWVNEFKTITHKKEYGVYPVKVRVRDNKTRLVASFEPLETIDQNTYKIITVNLISFDDACKKLFELCDQLEILQPEELRCFIYKKASEIASIYGNTSETNVVER